MQEGRPIAEQIATDSTPEGLPVLKQELQVPTQQVKSEVSTPKLESSVADAKEEVNDFDVKGQGPDALPEEMPGVAEVQPLDSEDFLESRICS